METTQRTDPAAGVGPTPPPSGWMTYPLYFQQQDDEREDSAEGNAGSSAASSPASSHPFQSHVSLFTSLFWLFPLYILANWLDKKDPAVGEAVQKVRELCGKSAEGGGEQEKDVGLSLLLLPLFDRFFEQSTQLVPPNAQTYYRVQSFTIPTPKGAKTITRAKVEGEEQPPRPSYVGGNAALHPPGVFSLWPAHNHFLVHYEDRGKLARMTYIQLDRLRFAFVAVKELLEEYKVFHQHDGSLTGLARRDIKKNCTTDSKWALGAPKKGSEEEESNNNNNSASSAVGRGGGNARLHQGSSGNVVTAPGAAVVQQKKEQMQKRFLRDELQSMCLTRWPHAPITKSCIFVMVDERRQCDLTGEEVLGVVPGAMNATTNKGGKRKGPLYYMAAVDLPLFNKKGGVARFKAERWWNTRVDAESDAAQVAIRALQNLKQ